MMNILKAVYTFFLDTLQTVLVAASVFLILYAFILQPHEVTGSSMFPTFKDKEYVLSYLLDVRFDKLQKGDVIVFHSPTELDKLYIKRIIGEANDAVTVEGGLVYLNGQILDETAYLKPDVMTYGGSFLQDGQTVAVPEGTFFVMGDNRPFSSDSREWGFLPKEKVVGRSMVRVWPPNVLTVIGNPYKN